MNEFHYGIDHLTVDRVLAIASGRLKGVLSKASREQSAGQPAACAGDRRH